MQFSSWFLGTLVSWIIAFATFEAKIVVSAVVLELPVFPDVPISDFQGWFAVIKSSDNRFCSLLLQLALCPWFGLCQHLMLHHSQ
jgi:hypothetical protein